MCLRPFGILLHSVLKSAILCMAVDCESHGFHMGICVHGDRGKTGFVVAMVTLMQQKFQISLVILILQ
jgi:hypothetical protein